MTATSLGSVVLLLLLLVLLKPRTELTIKCTACGASHPQQETFCALRSLVESKIVSCNIGSTNKLLLLANRLRRALLCAAWSNVLESSKASSRMFDKRSFAQRIRLSCLHTCEKPRTALSTTLPSTHRTLLSWSPSCCVHLLNRRSATAKLNTSQHQDPALLRSCILLQGTVSMAACVRGAMSTSCSCM